MQELKTRSARHQKSKRTLVINKKAIAPLVGTTLLVGPMMVTAAPQHVRADEQAPQIQLILKRLSIKLVGLLQKWLQVMTCTLL